jgi:hypothetical protein
MAQLHQACQDLSNLLDQDEDQDEWKDAQFVIHLCPYTKHVNDVSWRVYVFLQAIVDTVDTKGKPRHVLQRRTKLQEDITTTCTTLLRRFSDLHSEENVPNVLGQLAQASVAFDAALTETLCSLAQEYVFLWTEYCEFRWASEDVRPSQEGEMDNTFPWSHQDHHSQARLPANAWLALKRPVPTIHERGAMDPRLATILDMKFIDICFPLLRESLFTALCRFNAQPSFPHDLLDVAADTQNIVHQTFLLSNGDAEVRKVDKNLLRHIRRYTNLKEPRHAVPKASNVTDDAKEQRFLRTLRRQFQKKKDRCIRAMAATLRLHHLLDMLIGEASKDFPLSSEAAPSLDYNTQWQAFNHAVIRYNKGEETRGMSSVVAKMATLSRRRFFLACSVEELYFLRRTGKISQDEIVPQKPLLERMTLRQLKDYNARLIRLLEVGQIKWETKQYLTLVDKFMQLQRKNDAEHVKKWLRELLPNFPGSSTDKPPNLGDDELDPKDMDPRYRRLMHLLWNHPRRHVCLEKLAAVRWHPPEAMERVTAFSTIFFRQWAQKQTWSRTLHALAIMWAKYPDALVPSHRLEEMHTLDLEKPEVMQNLWETIWRDDLEHKRKASQNELWKLIHNVVRVCHRLFLATPSTDAKPWEKLIPYLQQIWPDFTEGLVYARSQNMDALTWLAATQKHRWLRERLPQAKETKALIIRYLATYEPWRQLIHPETVNIPLENVEETNQESGQEDEETSNDTDSNGAMDIADSDEDGSEASYDSVVEKVLESLEDVPKVRQKVRANPRANDGEDNVRRKMRRLDEVVVMDDVRFDGSDGGEYGGRLPVDVPSAEVLHDDQTVPNPMYDPQDIVANIGSWLWFHPKRADYRQRLCNKLASPMDDAIDPLADGAPKEEPQTKTDKKELPVVEMPVVPGYVYDLATAMDDSMNPLDREVRRRIRKEHQVEMAREKQRDDNGAHEEPLTKEARFRQDTERYVRGQTSAALANLSRHPVNLQDSFVDKGALQQLRRESPAHYERLQALTHNSPAERILEQTKPDFYSQFKEMRQNQKEPESKRRKTS